jgi:non-ribosomal peptide synthetase component F
MFSFSEALSFAINALAHRERTTAAMVMLAVFVAVASEWCRQKDFIVHCIVSGRRRSELVNVIGRFVDFLPLRIELSGPKTFIELLNCVSQEFVSAYEHVEFIHIARELPNLLSAAGGATYQLNSGLRLGLVPKSPLVRGEHRLPFNVEYFPVPSSSEFEIPGAEQAEVHFNMDNSSRGIEGVMAYRTALFRRGTMQRFFHQYRSLAERVMQNSNLIVA